MSGPTRGELGRVRRELWKIRAERVLGFEELESLGAAIKLLDSFPIPPEDGERAEALAQWLEGLADPQVNSSVLGALTRAARRACGVADREGDRGELLRHVAALLRQPLPPPAAGVSNEVVLATLREMRAKAAAFAFPGVHMAEGRVIALDEALAAIEALPGAAPRGGDHA